MKMMKSKWEYIRRLSVLDQNTIDENDENIGVAKGFRAILEMYVDPTDSILDLTCGKKLMWDDKYISETYKNVFFNDINPEREADYHFNCSKIEGINYDWYVFDPPYVNIKKRTKDARADAYAYDIGGSIEDLEKLTKATIESILKTGCWKGVIVKICDFHWKNELRGHHDMIRWFLESGYFILWDLRIYRFLRRNGGIPITCYKKKCMKTHSYYLIFKTRG